MVAFHRENHKKSKYTLCAIFSISSGHIIFVWLLLGSERLHQQPDTTTNFFQYKPVTTEDTVLRISESISYCIKIFRWWWFYSHNWYMLIVTEHKLLPLVLVILACITVSLFIIRSSWITVESFCSESLNSNAEVGSVLCRFGVEWNRTK